MRVICVILPLFACGEDLSAPADLSAADDLSAPLTTDLGADLAMASAAADLAPAAPLCPGALDGGSRCALDYFQRLAGCFQPSGYCTQAGTLDGAACYQSGAGYFYQNVPAAGHVPGAQYVQGNTLCAVEETIFPDLGAAIEKWTLWDGAVLYVDRNTGAATCAGGKLSQVGAQYALCPALHALIYGGPCDPPPQGTSVSCPPDNQPSPSP